MTMTTKTSPIPIPSDAKIIAEINKYGLGVYRRGEEFWVGDKTTGDIIKSAASHTEAATMMWCIAKGRLKAERRC